MIVLIFQCISCHIHIWSRWLFTAKLPNLYFHIIFDGRSTEPGSAPALLAELDSRLDQIGLGRIVDGVGRGVVLDRDKNYDKVKRAYDALTDGLGAWYS